MNEAITMQQLELSGQLYMLFQRSASAYRDYLEGGKTYFFARILRTYNNATRELLLEKGYLLSEELQQDALALITHYDIWMEKWDDLETRMKPAPNDEFVFPNDHVFPKNAASNLEREYQRLKQHLLAGE
ncbi:MAG: hypothetical protein H7Y42_18015 [Chitinophagaceae bacterium]|nr:hypothetical protein [Chitinophagaceae bacterium]